MKFLTGITSYHVQPSIFNVESLNQLFGGTYLAVHRGMVPKQVSRDDLTGRQFSFPHVTLGFNTFNDIRHVILRCD
jgi:hypothetical protein